jgi:hypothetical protein
MGLRLRKLVCMELVSWPMDSDKLLREISWLSSQTHSSRTSDR